MKSFLVVTAVGFASALSTPQSADAGQRIYYYTPSYYVAPPVVYDPTMVYPAPTMVYPPAYSTYGAYYSGPGFFPGTYNYRYRAPGVRVRYRSSPWGHRYDYRVRRW